jgi:hypothetical protein
MKTLILLTYIDPASGSIVFQILLAFFLGIAVYLKRIKAFALNVFKKRASKKLE